MDMFDVSAIGPGRAILIVGGPRSGKTSIVRDIYRASGATYDEVYAFSPSEDENPELGRFLPLDRVFTGFQENVVLSLFAWMANNVRKNALVILDGFNAWSVLHSDIFRRMFRNSHLTLVCCTQPNPPMSLATMRDFDTVMVTLMGQSNLKGMYLNCFSKIPTLKRFLRMYDRATLGGKAALVTRSEQPPFTPSPRKLNISRYTYSRHTSN